MSIPKFTASLYCICLSIQEIYTSIDPFYIVRGQNFLDIIVSWYGTCGTVLHNIPLWLIYRFYSTCCPSLALWLIISSLCRALSVFLADPAGVDPVSTLEKKKLLWVFQVKSQFYIFFMTLVKVKRKVRF